MTIVFGQFSAPCRQIGLSDRKRSVFFGGALSKNVVPRVHFGVLKIDKIDAQIDTKIDAEKVSIDDGKIIRKWSQNDREINENNYLFAKG